MTIDPEVREIATVIGNDLGRLVKLARDKDITSAGPLLDAVEQLTAEEARSILFGAVLVIASGAKV